MLNENSLDTLCGALCYAMGIEAPQQAHEPSAALCAYVDKKLSGKKADRVFMYNPDAIAQWVWEKYPQLLTEVKSVAELQVPFRTVMPSVTPVCFATMYTGAQPAIHGIRAYVKPVISIDTVFDALLRAGKKPAIVSTAGDSMSKIFLQRDMDYFIYDNVAQVNAKAAELILADEHDYIAVYNGNYDSVMHKYGPESIEALAELRANAAAYATFDVLIRRHWKDHNTLMGFAMDHGCHEIDGNCGSHGLDMEEDLNIVHSYQIYPQNK